MRKINTYAKVALYAAVGIVAVIMLAVLGIVSWGDGMLAGATAVVVASFASILFSKGDSGKTRQ